MGTTKKRVNITIGDEEYHALERLAKKNKQSVSKASLHLIQQALELEEDQYFSKIAQERLKSKEEAISHEDFWKRVDL